MVEIGRTQRLKVLRKEAEALILDGGDLGELSLSLTALPEAYHTASKVEVFVYPDSADSLAVTTDKPLAEAGQFALLKVVSTNAYGAFLDWGMDRDLLVSFRDQHDEMLEGRSYIVYLYFDGEAHRVTATSKIERHLDEIPPPFCEGEQVNLLIANRTDLGMNANINNTHWGVLYADEIFDRLSYGQKTTGYIKKIREDEKIDLYLHKPGYGAVDSLSQKVLNYLKEQDGMMEITDKSPPEVIYNQFGVSKKKFKMALGSLYKKRLVRLEKEAVYLVK
ncbi:MAG: GntR family transcriptional regulator [Gammaproteobacteria bacterium]|nr:MAG: GntR family transcriptional regulator [Gammaproteobacteria bacterium]